MRAKTCELDLWVRPWNLIVYTNFLPYLAVANNLWRLTYHLEILSGQETEWTYFTSPKPHGEHAGFETLTEDCCLLWQIVSDTSSGVVTWGTWIYSFPTDTVAAYFRPRRLFMGAPNFPKCGSPAPNVVLLVENFPAIIKFSDRLQFSQGGEGHVILIAPFPLALE